MIKCSCGTEANFSIRGTCNNCGKQCTFKYNVNPQEPQSPSTPRGKRRLANKNSK